MFLGILILLLPVCHVTAIAQESKPVQFSGIILKEDSLPLPYAHIWNRSFYRGTLSDTKGLFTMISRPGDAIVFSYVGYISDTMIIPHTCHSGFFWTEIRLLPDTIRIPELIVYQWPTYEDFKKAFLNYRVIDKESQNAERNIALIMQQIIEELKRTPDPGIYSNFFTQYYDYQNNMKGAYSFNNLLNPFAWVQFFEAMRNGFFDEKTKKRHNDYKLQD